MGRRDGFPGHDQSRTRPGSVGRVTRAHVLEGPLLRDLHGQGLDLKQHYLQTGWVGTQFHLPQARSGPVRGQLFCHALLQVKKFVRRRQRRRGRPECDDRNLRFADLYLGLHRSGGSPESAAQGGPGRLRPSRRPAVGRSDSQRRGFGGQAARRLSPGGGLSQAGNRPKSRAGRSPTSTTRCFIGAQRRARNQGPRHLPDNVIGFPSQVRRAEECRYRLPGLGAGEVHPASR